jgi:hypothetical protein
MKKLLIIFITIAMTCTFTLPVMAQDEAPAWQFYGSARMATFYSNLSDKASSVGGDSTIATSPTDDSDAGTIWNLQGNSRFGATVKGEQVGGGFEYGTGVNLRKLFGTYTMGEHEFLVGQTYTPIASMFYSNQVFAVDDNLLDVGNIYTGRDPMLQWSYKGLRLALAKPELNDLEIEESDVDSVVPQLEARYNYNTDTWFFDVFGGYNTYNIDSDEFDDTISAYSAGLGGGMNFGPGYVKAMGYFARNAANMGITNFSDASAGVINGSINDNDGYGLTGVLGFKATDKMLFEGGVGYTTFELDKGDFVEDETIAYYVQAVVDIVPGFFIVPEAGYYDFREDKEGADQGSETYFGAKWQINF